MPQKTNPFSDLKKPWITFCMPCFNEQRRIYDAIFGVLNQDYPNTELIVVNDGSTDRSAKEIKRAINDMTPEQLARFKFIHLDKNVGACNARNMAAVHRHGNSKYGAFLPADAYLYPGVAKQWVGILEDNPDFGFTYGGYKFISEKAEFGKPDGEGFDYMGDVFNPYALETANYIDGTYPLRWELFDKMAEWNTKHYGEETGAWDPHIKSLQDWDYWLVAVKQLGAKGYYLPMLFFETDYPHKGGLSDDSSHNWLARTETIKEKHGIPIRDICVVAFGATFHARNIAKILDADYSPGPNYKPNRYKMLYFVGGYLQFLEDMASAIRVNPYDPKSPRGHTRNVLHWIGSDIWGLRELPRNHLEYAVRWLNASFDEHLCEAAHTQKELKELGIKAKIVPVPTTRIYEPMPLPEKKQVAVYMPGMGMKDIYMPILVEAIAKELPDVKFVLYGDPEIGGKKRNITYIPYVNGDAAMDKMIKETSLLLRLTIHDGLPLSVAEFASAGRHIVTNVPVPHVHYTKSLDVKGIVKIIQKALKEKQNLEGAAYYKKLMDLNKYKKTIKGMVDYNPKEYWDKRAEHWDSQASNYLSASEVKAVKNVLRDIKAKSVIDVGCGDGQWIPYLPGEYWGIDISSKMVEVAKKKHPEKQFDVCSMEDLTEKFQIGEKWDVAFCHTVFLHIFEKDMDKAIKSLSKFAKKAIIVEPENVETVNYQHGHDFKARFGDKIIKRIPLKERTLWLVDLS